MTRGLRTTLVTALVALACGVPTAGSAAATAPHPASGAARLDCPPLDLTDATAVLEHAEAVTDVFAGTVRDVVVVRARGGDGDGPVRQSDRRVVGFDHAVVVEDPFDSDLRPGQRVRVVTRTSAEDGIGRLDTRAVYVFFATLDEGEQTYRVEMCSGTQKLKRGLGARLRDFLDATLAEQSDDAVPSYSLTPPADGARGAPALGRIAAPGAAIALIGVLGLFVIARINRRRG